MRLEMLAARIVRNGPLEGALGRRSQRAARRDLVLQPLEVDDVAVDGDADRHDEAGDARQARARGPGSAPSQQMIE